MTDQDADQTRRSVLAGSAAAGIGIAALTTLNAAGAKPLPPYDLVRPFRADIAQDAVDDMRRRLASVRWPSRETVSDRSQGARLADLQDLTRYWATDYDWRRAEARLNAYPQFMTQIDGVDIHFIHVRSRHAGAMPMIMTHGWPGSVVELLDAIAPLTDPVKHGGHPEDAFDLVIPSLPGFGFSGEPTAPGWGPERIATAWHKLMRRLGYSSYVAQGGDWGAAIAVVMARQAPAGLKGIHLNLVPAVPREVAAVLAAGGPAPPGLTERERATFDVLLASAKTGASAYNAMMTARPQTIGYGVSDSPVGLAAWLLVHPGFAKWQFGTEKTAQPTRDAFLDNVSLYWLTNTAASAGRIYWENAGRSPLVAAAWKTTDIRIPVAVSLFGEDAYLPPETWVRRAYPSLIHFGEVDKGGHFAAWEQPRIFAHELRVAFGGLR